VLGSALGCRSQGDSADAQKSGEGLLASIQADDTILTPDVPFAFCVKITNHSPRTAYVTMRSLLSTAIVWFQELSPEDGLPTGAPKPRWTNFGSVLLRDEAVAIPAGDSRHEALIVWSPADELKPGRTYDIWLELSYYNRATTTLVGRPGKKVPEEEVWRGKVLTNRLRCYLQPEPEAFAKLKREFHERLKLPANARVQLYVVAKLVLAEEPSKSCGRVTADYRLCELGDPQIGSDELLMTAPPSGLLGPAVASRARLLVSGLLGADAGARYRARRLLESFLWHHPESVFVPCIREQLE